MLADFVSALGEKIRSLSGPQAMSLTKLTTLHLPRIGPVDIRWRIYRHRSLFGGLSDQYGRLDSACLAGARDELRDVTLEEWRAIEAVVQLETAKFLINKHEDKILAYRHSMFHTHLSIPWEIRSANMQLFEYLDHGLVDEEQ